MASLRVIGFKGKSLRKIFLGKEAPKTIFFRRGTILPPRALIWGKKPGKNERLLRKTGEY
jgi:hypothetical protein